VFEGFGMQILIPNDSLVGEKGTYEPLPRKFQVLSKKPTYSKAWTVCCQYRIGLDIAIYSYAIV
jgi:hypothetical protein